MKNLGDRTIAWHMLRLTVTSAYTEYMRVVESSALGFYYSDVATIKNIHSFAYKNKHRMEQPVLRRMAECIANG